MRRPAQFGKWEIQRVEAIKSEEQRKKRLSKRTKETMIRDVLKERCPDLYKDTLSWHGIGPHKEKAIISFDVTVSPIRQRVSIIAINFSDMKTMFCDICETQYSEIEYKASLKTQLLPCGHDIMDCYNLESYAEMLAGEGL